MLLLPLVFVVILYRYPAGLLVYWITTNLWTIRQQYVIRRRMGPGAAGRSTDGAPEPPASRTARLAETGDRRGGGAGESAWPEPASAAARRGAAAAPPRKKKKRSGRRR